MVSESKAAQVMRHFTQVASRYDLMNTLLSFGLHHLWKRRAVSAADLRPGERVADLCGGTGDLALLASRRVGHRGFVVLYDLNRAMLLAGRPKLRRFGLSDRVGLVEGDVERLALADNCVDAALVGFGVRNLAHFAMGLQEMHRILKPGGRLVILEFSHPTNPLWRRLYDLYSFWLMPRLGQIIAGSREAYAYLVTSIRQFPPPEELAGLLKEAGFSQVSFHPLTDGIAMIHRALKMEKT